MTKLDDSDDDLADLLEVKPTTASADLVRRVLEQRIARTASPERVQLGSLWLERAIRTHVANALGDAGSLEASAIARTAPAIGAENMRAALHVLARIASAHPKGESDVPDVELAIGSLERAIRHLRAVDADAKELAQVSSWIARALVALGLESDDELRAELDDLGGLSDA